MTRAVKLTATLVVAAALPAAAQFVPPAVPDGLAPLPEGGAVCNASGTHCLVNKADLIGLSLLANIAGEKLAEKDREIDALQVEVAELKLKLAKMRPQCATVEKVPAPGARPL